MSQWLHEFGPQWLFQSYIGVAVWQAIGLFVAIWLGLLLKIIAEYVLNLFKDLTSKNQKTRRFKIVVALQKPIGLLAATAFWFGAIRILGFQGDVRKALCFAISILFGGSVIWAVYRLMDVVRFQLEILASRGENDFNAQLIPMISKVARVFVVVLGVLIVIQNLGFNVMSLMAGLGLGGLAFALAAKDTAANFFGSVMILIDRPFRVGDWIVTTDGEGIVEDIGFRSTRIRTFYKSLVSIPNSILATTKIDNMGLRQFRRMSEYIPIDYDTPGEKIEAFCEGIKQILRANPYVDQSYMVVSFDRFGASSLDIIIYCFFKVNNWSDESFQRQNIFIGVLRLGEKLGVRFARPTQVLHVETFPGQEPASKPVPLSKEQLLHVPSEFGPGGQLGQGQGLGFFVPPHRDPSDKR